MNKYIVITLLFFIILACKDGNITSELSKVSTEEKTLSNQKDVAILKRAFEHKNESLFMEQFPESFVELYSYFGWDEQSQQANPLYSKSLEYIKFWFTNLAKPDFKGYRVKIIDIATNGKWQADGINYFQDRALLFIKEQNEFALINELDAKTATSVLFFLFDGPHPKRDVVFEQELTNEKQMILADIFRENFVKEESNDYKATDEKINLNQYKNNPSYFITEADVNRDNSIDYVVSSKRMEGDELLFFVENDGAYDLALRSVNFSVDGGNTIGSIEKTTEDAVITIKTYSSGGDTTADQYIDFKNGEWFLTKTVYTNVIATEKISTTYRCEVVQNLYMSKLIDNSYARQIKSLPSQELRKNRCEVFTKNN